MIVLIIIFGFLFLIGNIIAVPMGEPKLFYVPLSVLLFLLFKYVGDTVKKPSPIIRYLLLYFLALSTTNIVKQVFYSERIKQVNDYICGGIATLILIIAITWEIARHRTRHGTK